MSLLNFIGSSPGITRPARALQEAKTPVKVYANLQYGWFIAFPWYNEYIDPVPGEGDTISVTGWDDVRTSYLNTAPVDWETIASQASTAGVDYVTLFAKNARGFRFWDSQALQSFSGYSYDGYTIPLYGSNFSISESPLSLDNSFLQNGIDAFKAQGIEVGLYYNIGRDFHIRTDLNAEESTIGSATFYAKYDEWRALVEAEIAELISTFPDVIFIWGDAASVRYPHLNNSGSNVRYENIQSLYDVFTDEVAFLANFNIGFDPTGSENTDSFKYNGNLKFFPVDLRGFEWYHDADLADDSEYNATIVHNGANYYIPVDTTYSAVYRIDGSAVEQIQYPWLDNTTGYWNGQTINQIRTQQEIQDEYDRCQTDGVKFNCTIPIRHYTNDIDPTLLNRLQNLVL
jgi:hypothetical protein